MLRKVSGNFKKLHTSAIFIFGQYCYQVSGKVYFLLGNEIFFQFLEY